MVMTVTTAGKLKPAARRRMATAVTRLMPWDILGREFYPPQAAVIDVAIRIALAVVDEGRDVENITDAEDAELAQVLAPIVRDALGIAEFDESSLRQGQFAPHHAEELAEASAFLENVTSGRYEADLRNGTRWAISRAAQMFASANAPTTALQARKLAEALTERRDRSARRRTTTNETREAGEGSAQTRVCAQ